MQGIVVAPKYTILNNGVLFDEAIINPDDLRKYVTYWDKIDYPDNNLFGFSEIPEYDFLIKAKVMKRTKFRISAFDGELGELHKEFQYRALLLNQRRKNEVWTLAQSQQELVLRKEDLIKTRTLNFEMHNSLPVPKASVPLEEILEFKNKRSSEIIAFRTVMGEFYHDVIKSADSVQTLQNKINHIENCVNELSRVMDESYLERVHMSMNAKIDITKAASALGGVMALSAQGLYPITTGIIGGLTAATFAGFRLSVDFSFKPKKVSDELKPYAYLYEVNKLKE